MRKISRHIWSFTCVALAGAALGASSAPAEDMSDATILLTGRLFKRSMASAMDGPMKDDPEAAEVMMSLRSTRDAALLPIFRKLRQSKSTDNQVFGMVSAAILAKDAGMPVEGPDAPDLKALFAVKDAALDTSALGTLINAQAISIDELKYVLASAPEPIQRTMAAAELNLRKKLDDRSVLQELMKSDQPVVRFDTAVTILDNPTEADRAAALDTMNKMADEHDDRQLAVEALMLDRIQKEKIAVGIPFVVGIAADEKADDGLRFTAIGTALAMDAPEAPAILANMINKDQDGTDQVKLGLVAVEFAAKLKPEALAPIVNSKSALAATIGKIAQKATTKADITGDLLDLIKQGHPIILDWAFQYSDRAPPELRLALRNALINEANTVDNVRDRDYERAALAVEKIIEDNTPEGRKLVGELLNSANRAVVDATLAGIYRSGAKDEADNVLQIWAGLTRATATENAANYAALILAREGRKEALTWLPNMVSGGTAQAAGFRALAGWYYAKLIGKDGELVKTALGD